MYRKAYKTLLKWKDEEKGKCAIMIEGARRVGKSFLAQEFAKNEYESYILIDFFLLLMKSKNYLKNTFLI